MMNGWPLQAEVAALWVGYEVTCNGGVAIFFRLNWLNNHYKEQSFCICVGSFGVALAHQGICYECFLVQCKKSARWVLGFGIWYSLSMISPFFKTIPFIMWYIIF